MEGRVGGVAGGIRGLDRLLREHGESIEYDLLCLGRRIDDLGTEDLTWRDLKVILNQQPHTSAFSRSVNGEDAGWGMAEQLLAAAVNELRWLHWAKTKDAGKASNRPPEPIGPSWWAEARKKKTRMRVGDAMTVEEFERRYAERIARSTAEGR